MSASPPVRAWTPRRWALVLHLLLWPVLGLFWVGAASAMVEARDAFPGWLAWPWLLGCGFMLLVSLHMAWEAGRRLGAAAPGLAVGPEGLLDRQLAGVRIPWSEIRSLNVAHFHTTRVRLELTAEGEARVRPVIRLLGRLGRAVGTPSYSVSLLGLGGVDRAVAEAVQAWFDATRPPRPAGADRA